MTVVEDDIFSGDVAAPVTWDDAAEKCINEIYAARHPDQIFAKLSWMRSYLDDMIEMSQDNEFGISNELFAEHWMSLGVAARNTANKLGYLNFSKGPSSAAAELVELLVRKQNDYGHDNISRFGRIGLLVRVHDKIARLENLAARDAAPKNESIRDNYMDVINYCAIGMMVEMGWFMLNLKPPVAEDKMEENK